MADNEIEDSVTWDPMEPARECQPGELIANGLVRFVLELQRNQQTEPQPVERVIAF